MFKIVRQSTGNKRDLSEEHDSTFIRARPENFIQHTRGELRTLFTCQPYTHGPHRKRRQPQRNILPDFYCKLFFHGSQAEATNFIISSVCNLPDVVMLSEVRRQQKIGGHPLAPCPWVVRAGFRLAAARLDAACAATAEFSVGGAAGVNSARRAPSSGDRSGGARPSGRSLCGQLGL
jgi:hypothetical protein